MNNREDLSEKCNPEKKEEGQKSKGEYEINLAIEIVLVVLRRVSLVRCSLVHPKDAIHLRHALA